MSKTLLFIILCAGMQLQAQSTTTQRDTTFFPIREPIYDTTAVIMMVSDTIVNNGGLSHSAEIKEGTTWKYVNREYVWWIRGYEVTKFDVLRIKYHVAWLYSDKKPMPYLVWESRRVK